MKITTLVIEKIPSNDDTCELYVGYNRYDTGDVWVDLGVVGQTPTIDELFNKVTEGTIEDLRRMGEYDEEKGTRTISVGE